MKSIQRALTTVCRAGTGFAFVALILAVLVQVIGRTVGASLVWTEELTRFSLLYMAAFGSGLSLLTRELVNVDVICDSLPDPWPKWLQVTSFLGIVVLTGVLIAPAWHFTSIGKLQTSPALGLRMDISHSTVLILLLSLGVFAALRLAALLLERQDTDHDAREHVG